MVALDARTGRLLWETQVADPMLRYSITAPPLALRDKIITGVSGGEVGMNGFIDAYDAAIRTYPGAPALPDAYYKKGVALRALKRPDEARAAFEYVVKMYPESSAASLAKQGLAQLGPPPPARKN